jgi:hypothetical protein
MRPDGRTRLARALGRLLTATRGTMALTLSQMFMGALTIGIATFRGTEAYEAFYYETQLGHANFTASKLGASHARSANSVANNNVISVSIMGPRFAVEADNLTMLANAAIACPLAATNPRMAQICAQFKAGYPRMLAKIAWVRVKQAFLWGSLGKLSDKIDKIASLQSLEDAQVSITNIDGNVRVRAVDPSSSGSTWGTDNTPSSCTMASKDALLSPMPGAAFPTLMETLLPELPKALTKLMPSIVCGISGARSRLGAGGTGKGSGVSIPQVPEIAKQAKEDCDALARQMQSQVSAQRETEGGTDQQPGSGRVAQSSDVSAYLRCGQLTARTAGEAPAQGSASYAFRAGGQLTTCVFDQKKCEEEKLEESTEKFLVSKGLPRIPAAVNRMAGAVAAALGGATHAPTDADWNHSDTMRTCSFAYKPVDETIVRINDGVSTIVSFGTAKASSTLRRPREYQACAKWYFPDGEGEFADTPRDQQPFVAAWKFALVGTGGAKR